MDTTIRKIIEIDQKAWAMKEKMEEMIQHNEEKLEKTMKDLEREALEKAKREGKERYARYIEEGEEAQKKILLDSEKECQALEETFSKIYKDLEEKIFHEIFEV